MRKQFAVSFLAASISYFTVACQQADTNQSSSGAWNLADLQPETTNDLKVLVLHDMEGLSGQDDWHTFSYSYKEDYERGQKLLVADINAVVDGLFAGGATVVHVVDGHGSGNPQPDVRRDLLDSRARQVLRDEQFDTYFDLVEPNAYHAVAVVGMHAKTGSGGFASHTYTLGIDMIINGKSITETELVGLSWGRENIPVIFASGDDRLAKDLETMPWIEFVTVKKATSASTVELIPVEEAHEALRDGARRAVENLASAKIMKIAKPIQATLHAVPPASLARLEGFPGIQYEDNSVTFEAPDLHQAYLGFQKIINIARLDYSRVLNEVIRKRPDNDKIWSEFREALFVRWLDVESGRWNPPIPEPGEEIKRKFHGYQ